MQYTQKYKFYLDAVEPQLLNAFNNCFSDDSTVAQAAKYSLFSGGKRIRAILCMAVYEMLSEDNNFKVAATYASALEMLHCYSLIHDDLPCMDNSDMRRGKASCHKQFGEATALLAGDALLTAAFETILSANASEAQNANAALQLAKGSGAKGMVLGQELDLYYESIPADEKNLLRIHKNKTGELISTSAKLGAIAAMANSVNIDIVLKYSAAVGLVFQIIDDVLDATSQQGVLGKPINNDIISDKTTFVKLFGVESSLEKAKKYTNEACELLKENFGVNSAFLVEFAQKLIIRST